MKRILLISSLILLSFVSFCQNKIYVNSQKIAESQTSQTINFTIQGLNTKQVLTLKAAISKIEGIQIVSMSMIDENLKTSRGKAILTKSFNKNAVVELLIENHIKEIIDVNGASNDVIDYFFQPKKKLAK